MSLHVIKVGETQQQHTPSALASSANSEPDPGSRKNRSAGEDPVSQASSSVASSSDSVVAAPHCKKDKEQRGPKGGAKKGAQGPKGGDKSSQPRQRPPKKERGRQATQANLVASSIRESDSQVAGAKDAARELVDEARAVIEEFGEKPLPDPEPPAEVAVEPRYHIEELESPPFSEPHWRFAYPRSLPNLSWLVWISAVFRIISVQVGYGLGRILGSACVLVGVESVWFWQLLQETLQAVNGTYDPRDYPWLSILPDGQRNWVPYEFVWYAMIIALTAFLPPLIVWLSGKLAEWDYLPPQTVLPWAWLASTVYLVVVGLAWLASFGVYYWHWAFPAKYTTSQQVLVTMAVLKERWGPLAYGAFATLVWFIKWASQASVVMRFVPWALVLWGSCIWIINYLEMNLWVVTVDFGHALKYVKVKDMRTASSRASKLVKSAVEVEVVLKRGYCWMWQRIIARTLRVDKTIVIEAGLLKEALLPRFDVPLLSDADQWKRLNDLGKTWPLYNIPGKACDGDILGSTIFAAWEVLIARRNLRKALGATPF